MQCFVWLALCALVLASTASLGAQAAVSDRRSVNRQSDARQRAGYANPYNGRFSDAEESLLKQNQRETIGTITRSVPGKSATDVQRKCVELGLRCGDKATPPAKNSEGWRQRRN